MDVSITTLDPTDAGALHEYHEVYRRAFDRDHDHPWNLDELAVLLIGDAWVRRMALVARHGEEVVGVAQIDLPERDNVDAAFVEIGVPVDWRRRGVGSALLDRVVLHVREDARNTLVTETLRAVDEETSAGAEFVRARGFALDTRNVLRELALPVDPGVPQLPEGFAFVAWRAVPPPEWIDQYAVLRSLLNQEAPSGVLELENEKWDADRVRLEIDQWHRQHRTAQTVVVVAPDGTVAGHTQLVFSRDGVDVYQWDTLVLPGHRGQGLGLALKRRAMLEAADLLEGRRRVITWNDEQNAHMIAVNEALGYRATAIADQWLRRLEA